MGSLDEVAEPRIVEIGHIPFLHRAFPRTTEFYSTDPNDRRGNGERGHHVVTLASLPHIAKRLADPQIDLVAVHSLSRSPWGAPSLARSLFRRSTLQGSFTLLRPLAIELLRGSVAAPVAVLDFDDPSVIDRTNMPLMDRATLFFKRELPQDYWQVFNGTMHWRLPTPRFREDPRNRARIEKLTPLPLGAGFGTQELAFSLPLSAMEKSVDIFFAGRIHGSSTAREHGIQELLALRDDGYRVDIPAAPVSIEEYLKRCASAWLVWSPAGYGWQCFRNYEAPLCAAVPLMTRPTIAQYMPLVDGEQALYYDIEPGALERTARAALMNRDRLRGMGQAAREHVLAHHTPSAIARYIVRETLRAAAGSP